MTPHNKVKAGPITLAVGLIVGGVVLLLYNLGVIPSLAWLWKLSPVLLIGIGLEYFLKQALIRDPEAEVRFSGVSLALIAVLILASGTIYAASATGRAAWNLLESMPWFWEGRSYSRTWESQPLEVRAGDRLVVNNPIGKINLRPSENGQLGLRVTVHAPSGGPAREAADRIQLEPRRSGSEITVTPPDTGFAKAVSYDLEIMAPPGLDARVSNALGAVTGRDLQSNLEITGVGRIVLERVAGNLTVKNQNGSTEIAEPGGDVTVSSGLGRIAVTAKHPLSGRYKLDCDSGQIDFQLPAESDLVLNATADLGKVSVSGLPGSDSLEEGGRHSNYSATLGSGKGRADLHVKTGSIEIRTSGAGSDNPTQQTDLGVETRAETGSVEVAAN